MSGGDPRARFLHSLPPSVHWEFCRVMDGLSDLDWTRFASEVLQDQTAVRLAERRERRTDWVMNHLENRNERVGYLIDVLERLQLFRLRHIILSVASSVNPSISPPRPPPAAPHPSPPPPPLSQFEPPPKESKPTPTLSTYELCMMVDKGGGGARGGGAGSPLPRPAPPPSYLQSGVHQRPQPIPTATCSSIISTVMCWSYEEVHAGTEGFSPALQVGEGGFGVVYRACLRNTDCAIKRLKQDCPLDWTLLKESFQTEVEKLSKFRHPNIVDLLGFSEGGGSMCLIYSYMDNRSLEEKLHDDSAVLSWSQRISIVKGACTALQFLHFPPEGQEPLIHGDVKSSNILLDRHLMAKLSDFGLARFTPRGPSGCSATQTASVGKTATVRGTLAYLPVEYVRDGVLGTTVDVYSFGVVLLEVLTGRRALEKDSKSGERYLKDLVKELEESPTGSSAEAWTKQLDERLMAGGAAEPEGFLQVVALASKSLERNRKKRPNMKKVFDKIEDIHNLMKKDSSTSSWSSSSSHLHHNPHFQPPYQSFPRPPRSLDSSVRALSHQMSKLGPLEDTFPSQFSSSSSSSSSSFSSLTPPRPLHSSSSLQPTSSSLPPLSSSSSSSFVGPCETDESRGYSQYTHHSELRSNETKSRTLSPSTRNQHPSPAGPTEFQCNQPSVPTEDQYNVPTQPNSISDSTQLGAPMGPDTRGQTAAGATAGLFAFSPARSLQPMSPEHSVVMNPRKQQLPEKKSQYKEGRIPTSALLSSEDLYGGRISGDFRGPEESDEFDSSR